MERRPSVVLLTGSYPYDSMGEASFLGPELPHLVEAFARVLVVPATSGGDQAPLPEGVEVDASLADALAIQPGPLKTCWSAVRCPPARQDVRRRPAVLRSGIAVRRLVAFAATARRVACWYPGFAARRRLDPGATLLYAYWLDALAAGLALARVSQPVLVAVSRAHGVDVYEERQQPPYLPCREWLLRTLDGIFLVSDDGRRYLSLRYPTARRLVTSRLGSPDPGFLSSPSADGILRVVSCSALLPVKRLDVMAHGFVLAAAHAPDRRIEWHHFGDGPLRSGVEALLRESAPRNLSWTLHGLVSREEIFDHYRRCPTDLFANTSRSEGIPVAIMEAQSVGIPVMAPLVGGIPEAVAPENGFLLRPPAEPAAVAEIVGSAVCEPQLLTSRREGSRRGWERRFRAGDNFAAFVRQLVALRQGWGPANA